jgi:hypothetical protein
MRLRDRFPALRYLRYRYSPTRAITQRGLRQGFLRGNRGWLTLFLLFRGAIAVKHAVTRQSEHLTLDQLAAGERMFIRVIPVRNAKERKRLMRGR